MKRTLQNKDTAGRIALLLTTFLWGTSFVIMKDTLDIVPVTWLIAYRFTGAFLLLVPFAWRQLKQTDRSCLFAGIRMGIFLYAAYVIQTYGLLYTTPGKNAFLTATYCVFVPFLWWIFTKEKPDAYNIIAAFVCFAGMGFVSLQENLTVGTGDLLTIASGLFYGLHIITTAKATENRSPLVLTVLQFLTAAVLSWMTAPLFAPMPHHLSASVWYTIAYLSFGCTGFCFLLQTLGQKYTPPSTASLILTLEAVFGVLLSVLLGYEVLTPRNVIGFVLIFAALLLSETKLRFLPRRLPDTDFTEEE